MDRKAQGNMWWIIIAVVLAVIVMILMSIFFSDKAEKGGKGFLDCESKGGSCVTSECGTGYYLTSFFECSTNDNPCCMPEDDDS